MPEVQKHQPGSFCWVELATSSAKAALDFYQKLFGWQVNAMPIGEGSYYYMLQVNGKDVGALYELVEEQRRQGVPPHWLSYIAVDDVDDIATKAEQEGGRILHGPMDVFQAGRMAMVQDPTGAVFALWQPRQHIGARLINEPGTFCWNELVTHDTAAAEAFYGGLFGWGREVQTLGGVKYTTFKLEERPVAGMLEIQSSWGEIPAHWMVYFSVADCDGTVSQARDLGGSVYVEPTDIPAIGRFSTLADPQGASFSVIKLAAA